MKTILSNFDICITCSGPSVPKRVVQQSPIYIIKKPIIVRDDFLFYLYTTFNSDKHNILYDSWYLTQNWEALKHYIFIHTVIKNKMKNNDLIEPHINFNY
jgi:hypothetical protein